VTVHDLAFLRLTVDGERGQRPLPRARARSVRRPGSSSRRAWRSPTRCAEAYAAELGATPVHVVPHGVDPRWSAATPARRRAAREAGAAVGVRPVRRDARAAQGPAHAARRPPAGAGRPAARARRPTGWGEQVDVIGA
jgi:hypothetical protein